MHENKKLSFEIILPNKLDTNIKPNGSWVHTCCNKSALVNLELA